MGTENTRMEASRSAGPLRLRLLAALLAVHVQCCNAATTAATTAAAAAATTAATAVCTTALNCSLNGVCDAATGSCACDAAWRGPACATLALLPTGPHGDLRLTNTSTWGMTVFALPANTTAGSHPASVDRDPRVATEGGAWEWHGLFAEMSKGCGLTSWETNSIISHATAPSPDGPWTRRGTALGVWAHTPSAAVARDGTVVLFHLGNASTPDAALPGSREYNATCSAGRSPCGTHPVHHCGNHSAPAPSPAPAPAPTSSSPAAPQHATASE